MYEPLKFILQNEAASLLIDLAGLQLQIRNASVRLLLFPLFAKYFSLKTNQCIIFFSHNKSVINDASYIYFGHWVDQKCI
jgi:hypothetical protein